MARFEQGNLRLKDNQEISFDTSEAKTLKYDGSNLAFNTKVQASTPTADADLTTKVFVEGEITTATGTLGSSLTSHTSDGTIHFTEGSIDHDNITNTHNLTTDVDHASITNAHNLTTDIDHDQLTNYAANEHFTQAAISITESQVSDLQDYALSSELTTASGDIVSQIPTDFYSQALVDSKDSALAADIATNSGIQAAHESDSTIHFTEASIDKYTQSEVDDLITTATGSLSSNHSELDELDYASAGHTGFQPAGSYVTDAEMTTISGDLVDGYTAADTVVSNSYIAADVILDTKIDTTSGTLQTEIDTKGAGDADYLFGSNTFSGTGDIYCNDLHTAASTIYIGDVPVTTTGTGNLVVDGVDIDSYKVASIDEPTNTYINATTVLGYGQINMIANDDTYVVVNDQGGSGGSIIFGVDGSLMATINGTQLSAAKLKSDGQIQLQYGVSPNEFSSDESLSGDSSLAIPTEKVVKANVDALTSSIATTSGTLQAELDALDYYTTGEVDTISGALNTTIDGLTSADIVHDPVSSETVKQMFDETVNGGVFEQTVITVVSGLSISWTSCEVYDRANKTVVEVEAGSGSVTDNAISYINWVSGTTATLSTAEATGDEVGIAHFHAQGGVIYSTHYEEELNVRERSMSRALEDILGTIVTAGCIVSEYTDVTNALDIEVSAGTYYHEGHSKVTVSGSNSTGNLLYRWYHDGAGDWTYDRNAEIDTDNYDTGTGLAAMSNNNYGKSMFIIGPADQNYGHTLHWFYPQSQSTSITTVIEGALPSNPAASEHFPHSTALVTKKGDTALPASGSDQWIDIRPLIGTGGTGAGSISDHGNLTGLTDDDHTQYLNTSRGDARYYTETEIDNFDYVSSTTLTTASGDIVSQIPTDYYTQAQVDGKWATWSGTIDHNTILNNHNLTTDIDHDQLTNFAANEHFTWATVSATIDHNTILNNHNLTTDIDHDQLTNFSSDEHFTEASIDHGSIAGLSDDDHSAYPLVTNFESDRATIATNWTDLTDGGDTTLHDHDGISENTSARHTRSHTMTSTSDHTSGNWKLFSSNGSGEITEITHGTADQVLTANGATSAPTWQEASGGSTTFSGLTDTPSGYTADYYVKVNAGGDALEYVAGTVVSGLEAVVDDTTPQLGGDLDINDKYIMLDPVPASDDTGNGLAATMTVDANATGVGAALYLVSDGNFDEADASAAATMPCSALALETGTGSKKVLLQGFLRNDGWAWTVGGRMYVSETTGALVQTQPSTASACVQPVGIATHADRIWFNPTLDFVEVAA